VHPRSLQVAASQDPHDGEPGGRPAYSTQRSSAWSGPNTLGLMSSSRAQMPESGFIPLVSALPNTMMSGAASNAHRHIFRCDRSHLDLSSTSRMPCFLQIAQAAEVALRRNHVPAVPAPPRRRTRRLRGPVFGFHAPVYSCSTASIRDALLGLLPVARRGAKV